MSDAWIVPATLAVGLLAYFVIEWIGARRLPAQRSGTYAALISQKNNARANEEATP